MSPSGSQRELRSYILPVSKQTPLLILNPIGILEMLRRTFGKTRGKKALAGLRDAAQQEQTQPQLQSQRQVQKPGDVHNTGGKKRKGILQFPQNLHTQPWTWWIIERLNQNQGQQSIIPYYRVVGGPLLPSIADLSSHFG